MYKVRFHFASTSVVAFLDHYGYSKAKRLVKSGEGSIEFIDERGIFNSVAARNVTWMTGEKVSESS